MSLTLSEIIDIAAADADYNMVSSSDEVWYANQENERLTDVIGTVAEAVTGKANASHTHTGYATASHVHSYDDLTNKPTIPSTYIHPSSHPASMITGLANIATSGSYNDLSDKPTIPSAYTLPAAGTSLGGVKSGGDVTISSGTITVNDDSHNHVISNVDGLQSALDAKASSSHTHTASELISMASVLFGTNATGGVEYSYGSNSGKNVLTEISNMPQGFHTAYAINGTTGNPRITESFRFLIYKTSDVIGWVMAWDAQGSVFTNYQSAASTFKGWKCLYDANPNSMILWSGETYMQSVNSTPQVVTPSKKLSECRTGWMLLWSDYDPGDGSNDTDFCTTFIPKFTPSGGTWGGKCFYCDIPMYVGSDVTDLSTEKRCIKPVYVHDDCLKGSYQNTSGGRNDVVLRAVYEV